MSEIFCKMHCYSVEIWKKGSSNSFHLIYLRLTSPFQAARPENVFFCCLSIMDHEIVIFSVNFALRYHYPKINFHALITTHSTLSREIVVSLIRAAVVYLFFLDAIITSSSSSDFVSVSSENLMMIRNFMRQPKLAQ